MQTALGDLQHAGFDAVNKPVFPSDAS